MGKRSARHLATRRAQALDATWRVDLSDRVFLARHLAIGAVAVCAGVLPALGNDRVPVALAVLLIVLPIDFATHAWATRHAGQPPVVMPFVNQLMGAVFVAWVPATIVPIIVILMADLGLAATYFGRRLALAAAEVGAIALAAAAWSSDIADPSLYIVTYALGAVTTVLCIGAVFDGERAMRDRHLALVGDLDAIVWEANAERDQYTYVSERANEILGYEPEQWAENEWWLTHLHPADRDRIVAEAAAAIEAGDDHELEYRMLSADGGVVYIRDIVTVVSDNVHAVGLRGLMIDITAQRAAEQGVRRYAELVERIQLALFLTELTDPDDPQSLTVVAANPGAQALIPDVELVGHRVVDVLPMLMSEGLDGAFAAVVSDRSSFDYEDLVLDDGERHFSVHAFPVESNLVGIALGDVTGPQLAAHALRRQATHDALTGLPNRVLLNDRLRQALRAASRSDGSVALLLMDLNQFKEVNDALGHHHGDRLLVAISRRLEEVLREADTVARLGGDEFAILLTTDATRPGAVTVARKIANALDESFDIEGLSIQTSSSIGIAIYPDHGDDPSSLAKRADVAMYNAKRSRRPYTVYAAEQDYSSVRRITLLGELRRALDNDELVLYHQPAFDVRTNEIVGAEALVRWHHPTHGLMAPDEFVDLAEVSGMIQRLSRWAVQRAISAAREWNADLLNGNLNSPAALTPKRVAVNLSVRNLYDPLLARWVEHLLRATGFPPHLLTLEVTESEVMDEPFAAVEALGELHDLGLHTSIDDFGTGQSSLAYLKHLPIDEIKIDKSFVSGIGSDAADATIVRAIIDLGHNLGLTVVAEGVEDQATYERLREFGCDRAQGFHLAKPLSPDEARLMLSGVDHEDADSRRITSAP
jgi:diguanylate cyclase (GGDEF)-like protein/PAS domain S-box-containing protein